MEHAWRKTAGEGGLALHDPVAVWVAEELTRIGWMDDRADGAGGDTRMGGEGAGDSATNSASEQDDSELPFTLQVSTDMRVETAGQWTRGSCVVDRRGRAKPRGSGNGRETAERQARDDPGGDGGPDAEESSSDRGGWVNDARGNRVDVLVGTPVWPARNGSAQMQAQTQTRAQIPHDGRFAGKLMERVFGLG